MKLPKETLAKHPFLANMRLQYLSLMEECATVEHFRPRQEIFRKGVPAQYFYLIVDGKVALETPFVPGEGVLTVQTLGAGAPLGWSWFFPPYMWHFTARAVEDTDVIAFKADVLLAHAEADPAFGYDMALRAGEVMLDRLQNTRMRLLELCEV